MFNKLFTFTEFKTQISSVAGVIVVIAFMVAIITAAFSAYLNKKDPEKRAEFITEITWTIVISFVVGAASSIVGIIFTVI